MQPGMSKQDRKILAYGRKREAQRRERLSRSIDEIDADIKAVLEKVFYDCGNEINAWYLNYATAEGLSLAEAMKAANLQDIRELERKAAEYVKRKKDIEFAFSEEAMKEMRRYNYGMRVNRLALILNYCLQRMDLATVEIEGLIKDHLLRDTFDELERQAGILGLSVPGADHFINVAEAIANGSFHNETFSERIWKNNRELKQELAEGLRKSLILGKNPKTWARSLEHLLNDVEDDAWYCMRRIAITESGRCQIEAQHKSYSAAGYDSFMVICEPTACKHCKQFDGKVFPLDQLVQGVNSPMFHPFCMCGTCPYMSREEVEKGFEMLEEASSKGTNRDSSPGIEQIIKQLLAKTDIPSEQNRSERFGSTWPYADLIRVLARYGATLDKAKLSPNGKKILVETNKKDVTIVISPSGRYFRIWNNLLAYDDPDAYYTIDGLRGRALLKRIRKERLLQGLPPDQQKEHKEQKRRTHFNYDSEDPN